MNKNERLTQEKIDELAAKCYKYIDDSESYRITLKIYRDTFGREEASRIVARVSEMILDEQ